jgi:hypothetical protein
MTPSDARSSHRRSATIWNGCRTLEAVCDDCRHKTVIDVLELPLDLPCPDVALRLQCSACGSKCIRVQMNMVEYYEVLRQVTGWQSPA